MDKEKYVEPMVADRDGNIYFSAKYISESKNDLQKRIDKAIQYLEKNAHAPIFLDCKMYETSVYNDLLKILKGGSNG